MSMKTLVTSGCCTLILGIPVGILLSPTVRAANCDFTKPASATSCGAATFCTETINPFTCAGGVAVVQLPVVQSCPGGGTCSQKCGSHGTTTCTESYTCTITNGQCGPTDQPVLDGEGNPVTSTIDKKGFVTCTDVCG